MLKVELFIEKTRAKEGSPGPIYYYYFIKINGESIGGGGNFSMNYILDTLKYSLGKKIDKMLVISHEEATKWIENGMWKQKEIEEDIYEEIPIDDIIKPFTHKCNKCGRKTNSSKSNLDLCRMLQPDGFLCDGKLEEI